MNLSLNWINRLMNHWATNDLNKATHLLMNRGKLYVPQNEYESFLETYLKIKEKYIVERFGNIFNFFLDIDTIDEITSEVIWNTFKRDSICLQCTERKGLHVIFPGFIVSKDEAKILAQRLKGADLGVYSGKSLRMPGSWKMTPKGPEKRSYEPLWFTRKGEKIHYSLDLNKEMLKQCRISVDSYSVPSSVCPIDKVISKDSQLSFIHPAYADTKITRIARLGNCIILNTNSRFCQNIQQEHKSNLVYFVLSQDKKIKQKCFCRCAHRTCSTYNSPKISVGLRLLDSLT